MRCLFAPTTRAGQLNLRSFESNRHVGSRIEVLVRQVVLRCVIVVALAAMFGGHVTELFDQWDHTARTGEDIDYAVVVVAGCIGAAFVAISKLTSMAASWFVASPAMPLMQLSAGYTLVAFESTSTGPSPPLLSALR